MKTTLYGLLAESPIHPGAGQSAGFVDLPVAREAATDYPVIVGSAMKGALRSMAFEDEYQKAMKQGSDSESARKAALTAIDPAFGKHDNAGGLLVSDARLLLLPIRSLTSSFMWVTCPYVIERYMRDCKRAGHKDDGVDRIELQDSRDQTPKYLGLDVGELFLEERQFAHAGNLPEGLAATLKPLIPKQVPYQATSDRLDKQLVVVSDDSFAWFARYGLAVNARNVLNEETKTSKNLWYQETLSPDSLFYWLLAERSEGALEKIKTLFSQRPYLQVGGNETVGQGWFAVSEPLEGGE